MFANSNLNGEGKIQRPIQSTFPGNWEALPAEELEALVVWEDVYEGEFSENAFSGFGKKHFDNGDVFTGYFNNNMIDGHG